VREVEEEEDEGRKEEAMGVGGSMRVSGDGKSLVAISELKAGAVEWLLQC